MKHLYTIAAVAGIMLMQNTQVAAQVYCPPSYLVLCSSGDYIESFSTTGAATNITNNFSGCNGNPNNYIDYSATMFVTSAPSSTFNFTVQAGGSWDQ